MTNKTSCPKSQNLEWGFFGTIKTNLEISAPSVEKLWGQMVEKIRQLYPSMTDAQIVEFLDSRVGRHLADSIHEKSISAIAGRIDRLTRIEFDRWFDWYNDKPVSRVIPTKSLLDTALSYELSTDEGRDAVIAAMGVDPEAVVEWLEAPERTKNDIKALLKKLGYDVRGI